MDRRSLLDGDATPTRERGDVFSDDFEVDDFEFDGVADGFRPNVDRDGDAGTPRPADVNDEPVRTVSAHYATTPANTSITPVLSRNSTRKSRTQANPFASPEDEEIPYRERPQSLEFEPDSIARRSTSSASSHVYAGTHSPRFGAGPSHPYGAYQQGTLARTLSVATTSTIRPPPRQSFSQNVPQHPYTMYPQGVDDDDLLDDDDIETAPQNPVPVGFPGLGQSYTRRLGPDGEDQDIIGADGHTEQLPPYSRYPEDGPEKMPLLVPSLPPSLHSRVPVAGTDPGMPLMHTALRPASTPAPPQSMTDNSELDRLASRTDMSQRGLLSNSDDSSSRRSRQDMEWRDMTWKQKRKKKFCGIPLWWILLALGVCTFIAAVLGGVLGGFIAGGNHAREKAEATVTSFLDASPIASPTGPPPPVGTFALELGPPEEAQCDCLTDVSQRAAWDCDLAPNAALGLIVNPPTDTNTSGASVFYASYDTAIGYGMQLSNMNTTFAEFLTVMDNDDPKNGPAFYFQQFYDKVVVIPEGALNVNSGDDDNKKARRQAWYNPDFDIPEEWTQRKQVIAAGEKPWFCVWNNTFLEGFIYISESASTSTTSMPAFTPPYNSSSPMTSAPSTTSDPYPLTTPTPTPPPTISTVLKASWTTATYVGPASGYAPWISAQVAAAKQRGSYQEDDRHEYYHEKRIDHKKRGAISSDDYWSQLDTFPYVIKLEERRLQNNDNPPYCQKYQILYSGAANWVSDDDGNPIIVTLEEQDPSFGAYQTAGIAGSTKRKRGNVPGGCHCQWMSGEGASESS